MGTAAGEQYPGVGALSRDALHRTLDAAPARIVLARAVEIHRRRLCPTRCRALPGASLQAADLGPLHGWPPHACTRFRSRLAVLHARGREGAGPIPARWVAEYFLRGGI